MSGKWVVLQTAMYFKNLNFFPIFSVLFQDYFLNEIIVRLTRRVHLLQTGLSRVLFSQVQSCLIGSLKLNPKSKIIYFMLKVP